MSQPLSAKKLHKEYCKSFLRIEVPLVVSLATKRMAIDQVINLVPGMIIQFDKPCTSPMSVEIDDQPIADGEVVKIGDKFGVRISQISPVEERFVAINNSQK